MVNLEETERGSVEMVRPLGRALQGSLQTGAQNGQLQSICPEGVTETGAPWATEEQTLKTKKLTSDEARECVDGETRRGSPEENEMIGREGSRVPNWAVKGTKAEIGELAAKPPENGTREIEKDLGKTESGRQQDETTVTDSDGDSVRRLDGEEVTAVTRGCRA